MQNRDLTTNHLCVCYNHMTWHLSNFLNQLLGHIFWVKLGSEFELQRRFLLHVLVAHLIIQQKFVKVLTY